MAMARLQQEPKKRTKTISQVQVPTAAVHKIQPEKTSRQYPTFPKQLDQSLSFSRPGRDYSHPSQECRVVIDLGTARLYLVYSLPGSERFYEVHDWDGTGTQECDQSVTFTALYYLPESRRKFWNGRSFLWGREVGIEKLKPNVAFDPAREVKFFKPAIHKTSTSHWYDDRLNEQAKEIFRDATLGVKKFALDFMDRLFEHLFHPEKGHIARKQAECGFRLEDVVMVLTMPSGWCVHEYEIFQQPAEKWGLLPSQIQYVPESDGAIRYWISKEGWRLSSIKTNSIILNVDFGAGTIDVSAKRITSFDDANPEHPRMENALPQRGLDHGIERIIQRFEESMLARFHNYPSSDAQMMARAAAEQFRMKWRNFENGDFFDIPPLEDGLFVTRDELAAPYQPAISAVVEMLEGIQHDLVKLNYDGPMCILLSGGGTAHTILINGLKSRFPEIPFHYMPSADLKKGCAKGAYLESLDRTNFTQHQFARASYAIRGTQECSKPGTPVNKLDPEEVRMLQLDPKAEKIKHKELHGYVFKKPVNEWFAKLHDPLTWKDENFLWREQVIKRQEDLNFRDILVEFDGHPGPGDFTIYDDKSESYKIKYIHVNLSPYVKHKKLGRANTKRYDYDTKLLEYCYRVEQDHEDRTIFFVLFRPDGDDDRYEKLQVYPTGTLNVGRLEGHRNLEDPSLSSTLESSSSEDSSSALLSNQLKNALQQHSPSTEDRSSSSDASTSEQNTSSDFTSSFFQHQATSTVAHRAPHHSQTQLPQRQDSGCRKRQKVAEPSFFDDSSTSRPSELETSTPSTGMDWPNLNTRIQQSISISQEQPVARRRSKREVDPKNKAKRDPLSSIDLNIKSHHGTRVQIQTSMLPRPKRVKFAAGEKKT